MLRDRVAALIWLDGPQSKLKSNAMQNHTRLSSDPEKRSIISAIALFMHRQLFWLVLHIACGFGLQMTAAAGETRRTLYHLYGETRGNSVHHLYVSRKTAALGLILPRCRQTTQNRDGLISHVSFAPDTAAATVRWDIESARRAAQTYDAQPYEGGFWSRFPNAHTIVGSGEVRKRFALRMAPKPPFRRERLNTPDGDFIGTAPISWVERLLCVHGEHVQGSDQIIANAAVSMTHD